MSQGACTKALYAWNRVDIQIMHIREVVSKNYSPRGNCIKVWNIRDWKPSVFWIFITLPRVDNFTNDRSPNVHNLFYKMVSKIWAVVSIQIMHIREVVSNNYSSRGNFIKVWNTRGWKPSVFWIFIKLPRVDNFTNDRSPNVHYLF